jgi:hypothetical protein
MSNNKNQKPPAKQNANNTSNSNKKASSAKASLSWLSGTRLLILLGVLALLAGVIYQNAFTSPQSSPLPSNANTKKAAAPVVEEEEPSSTVTSETVRVGDAEDDSVEHVHINLKANARADEGGLELDIAEADAAAKAATADVEAYIAHIEAQWTDFVHDADPVAPFVFSDDAATRRLESIALLLADHAALAEFMAFPYTPDHLRESPTLNTLDLAKRSLAIRRVTDHWRQRAANYHGLQRAATAFRDQLWSLVGDFEDATKLSPKDFLQLSRMERQIAAKEVKPDHDLFSQIQFSVRSHLFWEFLDDVLASKEIK